MINNQLILTLRDEEEIKNKIESLSFVYKKSNSEIIKIGILTRISMETLPNYKNYKYIISGITQARMIKGVNGKRAIESQLKKLFETYELEDINNDLVEKASELVIITFDSIFSNSGERVKQKYANAINDIEFLYINLKLAVKIIAESLRKEGIQLTNKTLSYIIDGIKKEKKDIAQKYINAYLSGDKKEIILARENYREKMEKMLNDYISSLNISYSDAKIIGMEQNIVENLGINVLDVIVEYLLLEIKERIMIDSRIQRMLELS